MAPPPNPKPRKPRRVPSKTTIAKVAVIGASAGYVAAKLIDAALIGAGLLTAVGSVAFAGLMLTRGNDEPLVYGMQYLAIFAQPSGGSPSAPPNPAPSETAEATEPPVDRAPVGAIEPTPKRADAAASKTPANDFELVAVGRGNAWVRSGARILSIHPGDTIPDLGKVKEIVWRDGHWTLIGENGLPMLAERPDAKAASKPLIVGNGK